MAGMRGGEPSTRNGVWQLTLAFLEVAPDRQCAELCLVAALMQGCDADTMQRSWRRWETTYCGEEMSGA